MDKIIEKLRAAAKYTGQAMMIYIVGKTAYSLAVLALVPASLWILRMYSIGAVG